MSSAFNVGVGYPTAVKDCVPPVEKAQNYVNRCCFSVTSDDLTDGEGGGKKTKTYSKRCSLVVSHQTTILC